MISRRYPAIDNNFLMTASTNSSSLRYDFRDSGVVKVAFNSREIWQRLIENETYEKLADAHVRRTPDILFNRLDLPLHEN
jgi:hypothetical protein